MKPIEISCKNVGKVFTVAKGTETVTALEGADLYIKPGEFVSLLGPSGCGKTTLLRLISGLEEATSGEVLVDRSPVHEPHPEIGVVFQNDLLMPWRTVLDNVLLQADIRKNRNPETRQRALELLQYVGLEDFSHNYPHQLSGGMRQRVGICRALLHRPRLLLMDEPFAALDAMTRDQMSVDLSAVAKQSGTTIVFVTHSITEAVFLSDQIYVMSARPGRIVADFEIDAPKPRELRHRQDPSFADKVTQVTEVFESLGVFKGAAVQSEGGIL